MARYYKAVRPDGTDFRTVPDGEYHTARHRFEPDTLWRRLTIAYVAYMVVCFIAIVILVRGGTS